MVIWYSFRYLCGINIEPSVFVWLNRLNCRETSTPHCLDSMQTRQDSTYGIKSHKNQLMESANSDTLVSLEFKYQSRGLFSVPSKCSWRVILKGFGATSTFVSDWGQQLRVLLQPAMQRESLECMWMLLRKSALFKVWKNFPVYTKIIFWLRPLIRFGGYSE